MKIRLVLPALLTLVMFQLLPQAAWSYPGWHDGCRPGYGYGGVSPWQARQMYRAQRGYGYGAYAPCGGGYGYPGYYHHGLISGLGRAIF